MTVEELIEQLEQYDRDAEIRVALQPEYPLRGEIQNVVSAAEVERDADPPVEPRHDLDVAPVVWIAVSQVSSYDESPYDVPGGAWA